MFRKPSAKKIGLKVLILGETGVGKSVFSLSFPKIMALDSETGIALYEGGMYGANLMGVANTQDFNELQDAMDEIEDLVESDPDAVQTLVIDSETKFFQNLTDASLQVEEKKARKKGADVNDANVSIRGYGRIKAIAQRLQNLKIDLSAKGVNVVSVSQIEDVKQKQGDQFVVTGYKPVMAKNSNYDYDLIIKLFTEKNPKNGEMTYKGLIEKDRTSVTKVGQVVENPSYNVWKEYFEGRKTDGNLNTSMSKDGAKAQKALEEEDFKAEQTVVDKFKDVVAMSEEHKVKAIEMVKEAKIKNPLEPKDAKELKKLEEIVETVTAM